MYAIAIAASLLTLMCLETMHFISRRYGEKNVIVSIHPVNSEQMAEILSKIEHNGIEVHSFSITDSVASLRLHIKQRKYLAAIAYLMDISKGLEVEIS